jgi:DHA1 family bicyclomycin/chloramphenicol resistance-like MFS transporter
MLRPGTFGLTALLAGLSAIGPLTTDMYLPSLPDIVRLLGGTTSQGQLTISAYLVGFAVGQTFYGPLSDRYGRKPVLLGALALYCVASLICTLATSMPVLIAARALQALGGCGGVVLARAVVRDLYSGARAGRELSMIGSVMALAPIFAPIVGGLVHAAFGWRANFFTVSAASVAGAWVVWRLLPETLAERSGPLSVQTMLESYGIVGRNPRFLAYLALASSCYAGLFAWISSASFILQDLYYQTPTAFGVAFALGSLGYMVGNTIAARLVVRLGLDRIIGVGGCMLAVGGLAMVFSLALGIPSAAALVVPMAIYLAGMGMVLPQSIAGAMTPFPERAGTASALFGFVQQTTASVTGAVVGTMLGVSAWPLAGAVSFTGCATLAFWIATRSVRAKSA